jgi:hypothetical protein
MEGAEGMAVQRVALYRYSDSAKRQTICKLCQRKAVMSRKEADDAI